MLMALPEAGRAVDVVAVGAGRVVCGEALTAAPPSPSCNEMWLLNRSMTPVSFSF